MVVVSIVIFLKPTERVCDRVIFRHDEIELGYYIKRLRWE